MTIQIPANLGHGEAARGPLDQSDADLPLQLGKPLAERGLGKAQRATGCSETAVIHDLNENEKVVEIEHSPIRRSNLQTMDPQLAHYSALVQYCIFRHAAHWGGIATRNVER
ncbi:UNVERIFIED_ORG: hypothetical protein GGE44_000564 [Rhizobium esperanzae]